MHVSLLGPLVVADGESVVAVSGTRQRQVLAYLALRAGEVVPAERIVVDLWGEDAPQKAANTLQQTVHRLRGQLPKGVLHTEPTGYVVRLGPDDLDVAEFTARVARGRALRESGEPAAAADLLDAALALWRGEALQEFRYEPFAQAEIARLEELRLTCVEESAEALLAAGSSAGVAAGLAAHVAEHPGRERLCGLLMRALYREGRQTDALDVYWRLRRYLDDELGLEPSPALAELERRILVHDPRLAADAPQTPPSGPAAPVTGGVRPSRRLVTVLCAQLLPPTDDPALDDIEAWDALVSRTTADVTRVVLRHGGAVVAVVGAQVVATFGVASVHEDDAVRAVAAAVEAAGGAAGSASPSSSASTSASPGAASRGAAVQCGVASGEALVRGAEPGAVTGDVVPRAVELARPAGPGGVVVDRTTQDLAGAAVEVDASGGLLRVVRVRPGARPVRLLTATPFVGRETELRVLTGALADVVRTGRGRTVVVTGEAGIGKTRLLRELAAAAGPDVLFLKGRCPPYGESGTFSAVRDLVGAAGVRVPTRAALAALLDPDPEAGRIADVLTEVLATDGERRTDPALIVWAVRRFAEVLAAHRPVVLVLDDLHWGHESLLDVAEQVAGALSRGGRPVLTVASCRPDLLEARPAWRRLLRRPGSLVELGTLAPQAVSRLLQVLSEGRGLGGTARDHLLDAAGGNPLFLEQLVAWAAERPDRRDPTAVPPSLTALLTARLQRLGPAEQEVLDVAAVLGRDVDAAAVVALLPDSDRTVTARHLAAIAARGLLVLREPSAGAAGVAAGSAAYAFRHVLIREVAYRGVPRLARARLHERVAQWLESGRHDDPALDAGHDAIGFHLERSVLDRRDLGVDLDTLDEVARHAAVHLERAASRASDVGDADRAAKLYRRAADVRPASDPDRAGSLVGLGASLTELGRFDEARDALDVAHRTAQQAGRPLWQALARVHELDRVLRVDVSAAVHRIPQEIPAVLAVFKAEGDERATSLAWRLTASVHWAGCRARRAEKAWLAAAELARQSEAVSELSYVATWLASAALWGPRPVDEAIDLCLDYLNDTASNPLDEAVVRLHLAGLYALRSDFAVSRHLVHQALQVYEEVGVTVTTAEREPAALAAVIEGDLDRAEQLLRHDDSVLAAMGETSYRAVICARLAAVVARDRSRLEDAKRCLETARELAACDDISAAVLVGVAASRILRAEGDPAGAVEVARTAVRLSAETDFLHHQAEALSELTEALEEADESVEAVAVSARLQATHRLKGVQLRVSSPRDPARVRPEVRSAG